ncbi:PilZ domain-containing protein [Microvirga sp. G4-2]|uniref:PilZ domain-containing protein n=1 Tax=Microvirga sp. G4-2 TaxID=3434467 RepID=UPI0040445138
MGSRSHIDDRRHARRFRARHVAKIVLGPDAMISCTVEDISINGARISLKQGILLPEDFDLFIAAHDLQVHRAHLCWRHGGIAGVSFTPSIEQPENTSSLVHRSFSEDQSGRVLVEVARDGPARIRASSNVMK